MALPSLARSRRFASSRSPVSEARECAGYDKCRRYATRDPPFLATCDLRVHPFVSLAGEKKFELFPRCLTLDRFRPGIQVMLDKRVEIFHVDDDSKGGR